MKNIIEGFSGYEIHYTLDPNRSVWSFKSNKWLKGTDTDGYYQYGLIDDNGTQKAIGLHKAYAMAFIPNPNNYDTVHHINHDHNDNRLENLMWISKPDHDALHAQSEKTRKKKSEAIKGEKNYWYGKTGLLSLNYGKHFSEETRKKMSEAQHKTLVAQYTKDENLLCAYESIHEAERQTRCYNTHISQCCNGKRKTTGGFKWKYITREQYEEYIASVS